MNRRPLTAGEKIFDRLFSFNIPNKFYDDAKTKAFKHVSLRMDSDNYADYLDQHTEALRTINNAVEMFRLGQIITPTKASDVATIYEIIKEHMNDWAIEMNNPVTTQPMPPESDMYILEAYAEYLFPKVAMGRAIRDGGVPVIESGLDQFWADFGGNVARRSQEDLANGMVSKAPSNIPKETYVPGGYFVEVFNKKFGENDGNS